MTLADKMIALNNALSVIDGLLMDSEEPGTIKALYKLEDQVKSVYLAMSQEWLEKQEKHA